MKLVTVILLVSLVQVSAASFAQLVTIKEKKVTLEKVIKEIKRQAGYDVLLSTNKMQSNTIVNAGFTNAQVEQVMEKILSGKDLTYAIEDKTILIKPKEKSFIERIVDYFVAVKVTGVVKSKGDGQPMPGVSITIKGTTTTVVTNEKGEYQITAPEDAVLLFRYIGHKTVEIAVNGRTRIDVSIEEDASQLKEVNIVSTGYQNLDRKLFTGATTKISAKDAERSGVPDISRMLEGQAAGVSVQNVSGTFGAAPKIRVRGATSLSGDNKPLWVVDGIILEDVVNISNEALSTGDANTLLGSSVAGLNPDDIESFNILKDAAATAMYGARAMNGVIVVTTKKGKNTEGRASVNYSGTFTTYLRPSYSNFDIMNSAEQMSVLLEMENKGYLNHAAMANASTGGIFSKMYNLMYDYDEASDSFALKNTTQDRLNFLERYAKANTNWFDVLFKNSLLQEHSISATSGTAKSQSYFSTSYTSDNGQTLGDNVKRFTGNVRHTVKFSDRLSMELLMNGSIRDQRAPGTLTRQSDPVFGSYSRDFDINPYSYALNTSRLITPYDENGNLEYFMRNYAPFNILNELNSNYMQLGLLDIKVQGGIKYELLPRLTYSVDGAYRYAASERNHYALENSNMVSAFRANGTSVINDNNNYLYNDPDFPNEPNFVILPEGGFYNTTINNIKNYYFRQNLEYDKAFTDKHRFNAFGSMEVRYTDRQNAEYDGIGYQFDNGGLVNPNYRYFKKMIEAGDPYFSMFYTKERNVAFMSRLAYSYDGRYSLNTTFRYDGSNRMGATSNVRWLPTWNVSGAWNLDQEKFYPKNKYLSSARFRGTYGLVANMGNASNSTTLYYNRITYRPYENEKETATYISSLANRELTWEKLYELNIGTDLGMFNDKINITMDYYKRDIFDLLGNMKTSGVGGQNTKYANYGKMRAQGFEFTIAGNPVNVPKGFKWRTQLNFARNTNEVTELEVNPNIWSLVRAEGAPMKGYAQRGLFSVIFDGLDPQNGYPTFIGTDGSRNEPYIYFQNTTDIQYLKYHGPVDPTFTGGFYNQFSYKGFTLSTLFTFATGNYVRLQPTYSVSYTDLNSMSKELVNRWVFPGDEKYTNIPAVLDAFTLTNRIYRVNGNTTDARYAYNAYNYSDQRVAKGDFVRLKNVSLSYQIPQKIASKLKMSNAQISLVGNNVALLYADSKLNGADPEFFNNGGVAMPIPRQYTLSIKASF
ncbi:MAG: SusC/RagA family TonB-linked outer membrane protein [Pedobacter sp.]|uniref:SusC/RagA family TonB-linked outer membrane protein n=1 Tax=Pedobacter sp. TaxID=1411316 RepID=UPI002807AD85|nr:SusC/RagA family TonB-linked outer membrane protein [Pedobacter sp.]MDQ8004636.1 SusC/RagA family TonB-linked outer membrane protein [Pedobacter sp.]